MSTVVRFDELLDVFDFVSSGRPMEHSAYVSVESGTIYYHTELADDVKPLPDDIDDAQKYIALPRQNDLGLGKRLVLRFTADVLPEDYDEIERIFRRRGAYAQAKELFERRGVLQQWYDYEAKRRAEALREWCEVAGIEVDDSGHRASG